MLDQIRQSARQYGWGWAIRSAILSKLGVREVRVKTPILTHPVWCRLLSSDIFEFSHLLGRGAHAISLPLPPEYIVDAGSNAGYSVLRFHAEYPNAKIVAIEPESRNLVQLKKNTSFLPNVSIESAALWRRSARLKITSLAIDHNAFQVEEGATGSIEALTVLDIMERHRLPRIDLLKVDIEGSEKEIFESPDAAEWIPHVRMILVETHDRFKEGCTAAIDTAVRDQFNFLGMIGEYRLYVSRAVKSDAQALI